MPAYNAAQYIEAAVQSVLQQTFPNWELLVVNDGSTDNTPAIVEAYCKSDERIKLINQANAKIGAARNTAIAAAQGEWIAFLDADDLWVPDKLEKQILLSKAQPSVDVIFTQGWSFYGTDLHNLELYDAITGLYPPNEMYRLLYQRNYIPVLSVLAKRSMVLAIGPQERNMLYLSCEDYDYWLRMAKAGASFYGMEERLFYYRKHQASITADRLFMDKAAFMVLLKNVEPGILTSQQFAAYLKPPADQLLLELIRRNRREEVFQVLDRIKTIVPSLSYGITGKLVNMLGKQSWLPLKILYRLQRI